MIMAWDLLQEFELMFISGLTLESKKKITHSRKSQVGKQKLRPLSTQFPDIYEPRALTSTKIVSEPKRDTSSHLKGVLRVKPKVSEGPVPVRHYVSQSRAPLQKQQSRDNRIVKEKEKQPVRKGKKLQLNGGDECEFQMEEQLLAFYRYAPLAVIGATGGRQELMKSLGEKGDFATALGRPKKRKGLGPIWEKLTKLALLKGKYKYRQKFNFAYSGQLKAMGYKRKEAKKRKESSSSSSSDEGERKERCRDLESWKKAKGAEGSKVFIVKGRYKDLRNALLERGWVENEDRGSQFYDLKWTTKVSDVNFQSLRSHQLVNHFNNNACLTSKYGIIKSLRSIMFSERIDIDRFFPKAFDICDLQDFQNFLQVYKWVYAAALLKRAIAGQEPGNVNRIAVALMVILRRLMPAQKLLSSTVVGRYALCSLQEWRFLLGREQKLPVSLSEWEMQNMAWQELRVRVVKALQQLQRVEPQFLLDGAANIWIAKPAFLSRGRGIKCVSELQDILDYTVGKETQYIVQKYIENPMIINRRKFDIRQWVIVQEYCPPRIWFYGEFYLRFCLEDYDPSKLGNRFAHLTNNSVQKHNSKVSSETLMNESMWTMQQMEKYVQGLYGEGSFKTVVGKMREIVVATILGTQDQVYGRKGSFQLIGYDFMVDELLNPWLIEVNSSPSMDYSTPVTRRLVKMVLEDTVKVMVDERKKKTKKRGLFKLIYDGEAGYDFKYYAMGKQGKE